jgi:hypothetical protein
MECIRTTGGFLQRSWIFGFVSVLRIGGLGSLFMNQDSERCTVDRWAEVAVGSLDCGLADVSVAEVSPRGAGRWRGRRGTHLTGRHGAGSPDLAMRQR